ncbi:MAG: hypothetical protein C0412_21580 [Flavobacterium sp.]|nr:hypothetical protein [Flavobacterium sp.]
MKLLFFSLLLVFVLSGCDREIVSDSELSKKDNGQNIEYLANMRFNLNLEGNPSTGYNWKILSIDSSKIEYLGHSDYVYIEQIKPGSTGRCTYEFKTKGKGTTILKLGYLREWEKGIPPIDSFKVNINIK